MFKVGDQIVYIPSHADDMFHPDAEFGFITGFNGNGDAFCRYWLNPDKERLRTKANSGPLRRLGQDPDVIMNLVSRAPPTEAR